MSWTSFDSLKEEIRDVFHIFDEDDSCAISIPHVARALQTVTGERVPRSELLSLVASAREVVSKRHAEEHKKNALRLAAAAIAEAGTKDVTPDSNMGICTRSPHLDTGDPPPMSQTADNSDGVDIEVFEQVVFRKVNSRTYEEELSFAFALLEDKYYPGFITKESLKRAAAVTEETLTEAEIEEMFDSLVTNVPSAAIDFATFTGIQMAARRMEDQA